MCLIIEDLVELCYMVIELLGIAWQRTLQPADLVRFNIALVLVLVLILEDQDILRPDGEIREVLVCQPLQAFSELVIQVLPILELL